MRETRDIKAPDGYLIGGERLVRRDGTVLFQRGWWQCPTEWAGEYIMLHALADGDENIEIAPPGYHSIYQAQLDRKTILAPRTNRRDAKSLLRNPVHVAWRDRNR